MPSRNVRSVLTRITIMLAVVGAGAGAAGIVAPALASSTSHAAAARRGSPGSPRAGESYGRDAALISPVARRGRLSPAATGKAVSTCVYYASKAGWADNGYYGGDLVTAATICVAESGGDPNLIVCDGKNGGITGQGNYPKFTCPKDTVSYDRGLWQLNSFYAKKVSNKCAFNPACNAGQAYEASVLGISFAAWASYDTGGYAAPFLDLVQAGVLRLGSGTVTSALLGECLARGGPVTDAKAVVANCGSGTVSQSWSQAGGKLTSGSLCAAIASSSARNPGVVLQPCARSKAQDWSIDGRDELRDAADGKCLTDPDSSLTAGAQVDVTSCANTKDQTWWLP